MLPMNMTTDNTYIYPRVSSDEQRERATIETQRVEIAKYCERQEWFTPEDLTRITYSDDGFSGRTRHLWQRPEGARMLDDIAAAAARGVRNQVVIVYRADRIGRGRKMLSAIDRLEELGVRYFVSVTEGTFDFTNPNDMFHLSMLAGVSGYESESFLRRSADASYRLASEGQHMGGPVTYGYHVEGQGRTARLAISEKPIVGLSISDEISEAGVARLIFHWCADLGWSCWRIAQQLNEWGVPTPYKRDGRMVRWGSERTVAAPTSGTWRFNQIARILHNPTYKGVRYYGVREKKHDPYAKASASSQERHSPVEQSVPALVDSETWQRAQEQLTNNMRFSPKNSKNKYLLRGFIICGVCGLVYSGVTPTRLNERPRYRCASIANNVTRCANKTIDLNLIETTVSDDIINMIDHPDEFVAKLAESLSDAPQQSEKLRDDVADLQLKLSLKHGERDSMLTLFRRGRIDEASLNRQMDEISDEERDLRGQLADKERELRAVQQSESTIHATSELLRQLRSQLDQLRALEAQATEEGAEERSVADQIFALKRRWVELFVKRIIARPQHDATGKLVGVNAEITYRFMAPATTFEASETATIMPGTQTSVATRTPARW